MNRWLLIATLLVPMALFAQSDTGTMKLGNVEVILDDPYIDSLMEAYRSQAKTEQAVKGFRVQVIAAGNRADINKVKGQFYTLFPDIKTFVIYQQPNFKLRVGNYRSKLEAYKAWVEIVKHFPGAFITPDELKLNEL